VKDYAADTGYNIKARRQGSSLVIEAEGIAAHGAHPELGLNALSIMMDFLGRLEFPCDDLTDFISFYNEHIGFDLHGERIGCKFEDNPSGPLIFNVGKANISEELANITVNIRYPVTYTDTDVISGIETVLEGSSVGIITGFVQAPIFMDLDNPMVKKMLKAYIDETGDTESKPIVQGGGSYAKMVNNILAFGALLPDEENTMHQADERFRVDSFMKMARIYARTLLSLCCE
jgi:succinyl-diaminopimelate desuccinylase